MYALIKSVRQLENWYEGGRMTIGLNALGAISAYEDLKVTINEILVKDPNGFFTIWKSGVYTPHDSPVGSKIELRVLVTSESAGSGGHTVGVSFTTNLLSPYNKGCKTHVLLTGGVYDTTFDWNLGKIPETGVVITVTPWISPNATEFQLPPEDQW